MGWREVFNPPKPKPEPPEPMHRFLVVRRHNDYFGSDWFDAETHRPHLPDVHTLLIQRDGMAAAVVHYGPRGWLDFAWVMRKPSEIAIYRKDLRM